MAFFAFLMFMSFFVPFFAFRLKNNQLNAQVHFKYKNVLWLFWNMQVEAFSHLCHHAPIFLPQNRPCLPPSSTLHDGLMQQLLNHRWLHEHWHWLQSLHSTRSQTKELFSTAFYRFLSLPDIFLLCFFFPKKNVFFLFSEKLNTENCNKSYPESFLIETSFLIEFVVSTDNIMKCSTIYIDRKLFWSPHVSLHHRKK